MSITPDSITPEPAALPQESERLPAKPDASPASADVLQLWVHVVIAALAMVATLPGRTHGLGLITMPLLRDLTLDPVDYATMNLWGTLLGALFCLPCGWLIDRFGTRLVLTGVSLSLCATVVAMGFVQPDAGISPTVPMPAWLGGGVLQLSPLFFLILLTRGLGQSALSVVSLALVGRAAGRHGGVRFGVYSFVVALGFMLAFLAIKAVLEVGHADWRSLWTGIGVAVGIFGVLAFVSIRPTPKSAAEEGLSDFSPRPDGSYTLGQALRSPTFWVFAVATSLYGMIAAGVSLFNQAILEERHFDRGVFLTITAIGPLIGLASNLATGWLTTWFPMHRLLCGAMLVLAAAMALFPFVTTLPEVYAYAVLMSVAGGMVTVLFFAVWSHAFGPAHLGKIQGAAQLLTVLSSAAGPLLVAGSKQHYGSYLPLFYALAAVSAVLGVIAWFTAVRPREPA
jgi:MFS family permease